MAKFDVAHLREQNVDLIIIPLGRQFDFKSQADQRSTIDALQRCATAAGLTGTVVPIWQTTSGSWAPVNTARVLSLCSVLW
jgi:hypothetical protein